jgi:crotonobetainyl-CoA:carnitine CoA-transferase CaiB-like acyl-CoA transferase
MAGPLTGIRVVELGIWAAAPAAAGVLADWGAEVIKVEAPGGDPQRGFSPHLGDTTVNPTFEMNNRGKRAIALDLRTEPGHAAMLRLLDTVSVPPCSTEPGRADGGGLAGRLRRYGGRFWSASASSR